MELDWAKAKAHFDEIHQAYKELEGQPGVNTTFALKMTFEPIARRYESGERTEHLYAAMLRVK